MSWTRLLNDWHDKDMTILETRFMEQMPRLLSKLLEEVTALRVEVAELRKELKTAKGEQD